MSDRGTQIPQRDSAWARLRRRLFGPSRDDLLHWLREAAATIAEEGDAPKDGRPSADEVIAAVNEAIERAPGVDIIYVHGTRTGGAHAAIVKVGTPAYDATRTAYPHLPLPPHDHIEPGMW